MQVSSFADNAGFGVLRFLALRPNSHTIFFQSDNEVSFNGFLSVALAFHCCMLRGAVDDNANQTLLYSQLWAFNYTMPNSEQSVSLDVSPKTPGSMTFADPDNLYYTDK
jgi:hypothetical protein